jgi:putative membrane protein
VTTLVVSIDRGGAVTAGVETPVVGWEAVESLVTEFGVSDPEDSRVNCLLEALRVTRDLRDEGDDATVAVLSGAGEAVSVDRSIARQVEELVDRLDPDSAVVVVDSAEDERLVPIIESRLTVDAVDRVVVRQARDIESTYYLLKQFLGDEQLRKTVLVPLGAALVVFPVLLWVVNSVTLAVGAIAAAAGVMLLYKGLGIDEYIQRVPSQVREALYSGQVALVTYVVAVGLGLIGLFVGALGVSNTATDSQLLLGMRFVFDAVPWLTAAALAASTGRLIDELLRREGLRNAYLNLPFGAVAVGLVVRGVTAYFLTRSDISEPTRVPAFEVGPLSIEAIVLSPRAALSLYLVAGVLVSLLGVRFTSYLTDRDVEAELLEEGQ